MTELVRFEPFAEKREVFFDIFDEAFARSVGNDGGRGFDYASSLEGGDVERKTIQSFFVEKKSVSAEKEGSHFAEGAYASDVYELYAVFLRLGNISHGFSVGECADYEVRKLVVVGKAVYVDYGEFGCFAAYRSYSEIGVVSEGIDYALSVVHSIFPPFGVSMTD